MTTPVTVGTQLTESERLAYNDANDQIRRHIEGFTIAAALLAQVRDRKLYREEYATFEEYCQGMWGWSRQRAYQLIGAAEVVTSLSTTVDTDGLTERHARELGKVPAEQRATVLEEARADAASEGKRVTAERIKDTAHKYTPMKERAGKKPAKPKHETPEEAAAAIARAAEKRRSEGTTERASARETRAETQDATEPVAPPSSEAPPTEADGGVVTSPDEDTEASNPRAVQGMGEPAADTPAEPRASSAEGAVVVFVRAISLPDAGAVEGLTDADIQSVREMQAWCGKVIAAHARAHLRVG
ncbi:MAG: hypothetical protein AMXMBFR53_36570 [Gemmatimonadota bacterium]